MTPKNVRLITGPQDLKHTISLLDVRKLAQALEKHKFLYLICVNAWAQRNNYIEYGLDVHQEMERLFESLWIEIWQELGHSSHEDLFFKKDSESSLYLLFTPLQKNIADSLPYGFLKRLAGDVYVCLQKRLKTAMDELPVEDHLYGLQDKMLSFSVGYASMMHNHCFHVKDQVSGMIRDALRSAERQKQDSLEKEKEFLYALMSTEGFLYTRFQGVFDLQQLTLADVQRSREQKDYTVLKPALYGFESLLGVHPHKVEEYFGDEPMHFHAHSLNPLSLFTLAKRSYLSLELDQTCIALAVKQGKHLPGELLVNIFPRNFYYIEKLAHLIPSGLRITFELAESRVIKNFEFLLQAKSKLKHVNCRIATDDVCKGYANIHRLLAIGPDLVKLDRGVIMGMENDPKKMKIVELLVDYSKQFEHKILAEGVETEEEFVICQQLGIDYVQGFLLHKPVPVDEVNGLFHLLSAETSKSDAQVESEQDPHLKKHSSSA